MIIGADEVGYGSWAGPLVVCAVKVPEDWSLAGLTDSKQLTSEKREEFSEILLKDPLLQYKISEKSNDLIDQKKLGVCLKEAYVEVISALLEQDDRAIVDGVVKLPLGPQVSCMIKADQKVMAVSAASVIAKVYRDTLMKNLAPKYSEYDWENNVGYGTAKHKAAIKKFGMTDLHRKSYKIKL